MELETLEPKARLSEALRAEKREHRASRGQAGLPRGGSMVPGIQRL